MNEMTNWDGSSRRGSGSGRRRSGRGRGGSIARDEEQKKNGIGTDVWAWLIGGIKGARLVGNSLLGIGSNLSGALSDRQDGKLDDGGRSQTPNSITTDLELLSDSGGSSHPTTITNTDGPSSQSPSSPFFDTSQQSFGSSPLPLGAPQFAQYLLTKISPAETNDSGADPVPMDWEPTPPSPDLLALNILHQALPSIPTTSTGNTVSPKTASLISGDFGMKSFTCSQGINKRLLEVMRIACMSMAIGRVILLALRVGFGDAGQEGMEMVESGLAVVEVFLGGIMWMIMRRRDVMTVSHVSPIDPLHRVGPESNLH